jgi:hypothetical protein
MNPETREVLLFKHRNSPELLQVPDNYFQDGLRVVTGDPDWPVKR